MTKIHLDKEKFDQLTALDIDCLFIKFIKMHNPKMLPAVVLLSDQVYIELPTEVLKIINN
jgi:hypothetical protein